MQNLRYLVISIFTILVFTISSSQVSLFGDIGYSVFGSTGVELFEHVDYTSTSQDQDPDPAHDQDKSNDNEKNDSDWKSNSLVLLNYFRLNKNNPRNNLDFFYDDPYIDQFLPPPII